MMNWKNRKSLMPVKVMIPLGLFITTSTFLISHDWVKMPDFLQGGLTGVGIGIMLAGLIKLKRKGKEATCANQGLQN